MRQRTRKLPEAPTPSEHEEQAAYFRWLKFLVVSGIYPDADLAYKNANEQKGGATIALIQYLKAEGLKAGVSDVFFPDPKKGYHGLYIEFKKRDRSEEPTEDQKYFIRRMNEKGYLAVVCYGCDEGRDVTEKYLGLK